MGLYEYQIRLNASPLTVKELNDLPLKALPEVAYFIFVMWHMFVMVFRRKPILFALMANKR